MDYEIHQVLSVSGYGKQADEQQRFLAFYGLKDEHIPAEHAAFFTVRRKPRLLSSKQHARGARSAYLGQEIFISLVDSNEAPYSTSLVQLGINTPCAATVISRCRYHSVKKVVISP